MKYLFIFVHYCNLYYFFSQDENLRFEDKMQLLKKMNNYLKSKKIYITI